VSVGKKLTAFLLCFANSNSLKGCALDWSLDPMPLSQRKARAAEPCATADQAWITLMPTKGANVRFRGAAVAEATSYSVSVSAWHVITLYRHGASGRTKYIVSIRTHQKSVDAQDVVRVFKAATIEAVMDLLERYTPEDDVASSLSPQDYKALGPVQAALHTAKTRSDISQVRRHYDAMVGDFLFSIGTLELS
jgi:hypothetical protein